MLTALLVGVRGKRRARGDADVGLRPAGGGGARLDLGGVHQAAAARARGAAAPTPAIEIVRGRRVVQRITYTGQVPPLFDTLLYEPTVRAGLRRPASRGGCSRATCAPTPLYLLALVVALLVLAHSGVLA